MALTNQQLLDLVEAALAALLDAGVKSYTVDGRSFTKLDLPELMKQRDLLRGAIARAKRGSFGVANFRRPGP